MSANLTAVPGTTSPHAYNQIQVKVAYNEATVSDGNGLVIFQGTKQADPKHPTRDLYVGGSPNAKIKVTSMTIDHKSTKARHIDLISGAGKDDYIVKARKLPQTAKK